MSGTYEDLEVWKAAMQLVREVYNATQAFPSHELYGLTNQMRRAAVSVPSNIAEGKGRNSDREFLQFLRQARGSIYELQTQISIANDLAYTSESRHQELRGRAARVGQMLNGMIRFLTGTAKSRPGA